MCFPNIASENRHRADTQAQREEGLIHRSHKGIDYADFFHSRKIRNQIELQPLCRARHKQAVNCQNNHNYKQRDHHYLRNLFETILQPYGTNEDSDNHHEHHPEHHNFRICKHFAESTCDFVRCLSVEFSCRGQIEIVQHPSRYRRVEHHQKVAAHQGQIAVDMPFLSRFFKCLISSYRAFAAGAADRKFHRHNRKS